MNKIVLKYLQNPLRKYELFFWISLGKIRMLEIVTAKTILIQFLIHHFLLCLWTMRVHFCEPSWRVNGVIDWIFHCPGPTLRRGRRARGKKRLCSYRCVHFIDSVMLLFERAQTIRKADALSLSPNTHLSALFSLLRSQSYRPAREQMFIRLNTGAELMRLRRRAGNWIIEVCP